MSQFLGFGRGTLGPLTVSGTTSLTLTKSTCSGTAGSRTLTVSSSINFLPGDYVLIHKTRGETTTTPGTWELNQVESYSGTTLTLVSQLINTYQNSGSDRSQVLVLKEYSSVTVDSGATFLDEHWTGTTESTDPKGGILTYMCSGTTTVNGTISAVGYALNASLQNSNGYNGGINTNGFGQPGESGEGTGGPRGTTTTPANGSGGGRGPGGVTNNGGAGGGNGGGGGSSGGTGGNSAGTEELDEMCFGGGGGGAGKPNGTDGNRFSGQGGGGGAIILVFTKYLIINDSTGLITADGADGVDSDTNTSGGGGGGGAGGSILIKSVSAQLGTDNLSALGGDGGIKNSDGTNGGGAGGGRIRIETGSYTGSVDTSVVDGGTGANNGGNGSVSIETGGFSWLGGVASIIA